LCFLAFIFWSFGNLHLHGYFASNGSISLVE
jgi:hypothetical protein